MAKYQEIIGWISEQIDKGAYPPGSKIPSENELCEQFDISRQTARHAIAQLIKEGKLMAQRGSGTYVKGDFVENASKRIAVVTTYVDSYIFPKTIQGIENKLTEYGYTMQLSFTGNTFTKERAILQDLLGSGDVAGLLIEPSRSALPNPNIDLLSELDKLGTRILFLNSNYTQLPFPHVSLADKECAYRAVKELIDAGHRNIACILKLDDRQGHERYSGYLKAMMEAGLPVNDAWVVWLDTDDISHMKDNFDRIRRRFEGCTALFAYNDQVAVEAIGVLLAAGINVPSRMSVVSMDDSDMAKMNGLELDSVPHPKERLGEKAAENIIHLIHNKNYDATYEFIEDVIKRGSVRNVIF